MQEPFILQNYNSFEKFFSSLTPNKQAGFLLWPSVLGTELTEEEKKLFEHIKPTGVVLFKRNFSSITQAKSLVDEIKKICARNFGTYNFPFVVATDEEGGRVSRLPLPEKTKPVLDFVKNKDKEGLKNQIKMQIDIAKKIGINCIFAPVLDILTEQTNTVIGNRSFGENFNEVCEYAKIVYDILQSERILSCGKHFPGHGNTKEDSHFGAAVSNADLETLEQRECKPFEYFIKLKIPMIMAAHVILPNLHISKSSNLPSTLNDFILIKILREKLKFKGLLLSDDLRMGAIREYYISKGINSDYLAYAGIDAIKSGCDVLLSCQSISEEKVITDSIVDKIKSKKSFFDLCCKKSFHQAKQLSLFFDMF